MSLDDCIAKVIVDNVSIFKYIHPNVITLLGMFLNFVVIYLIKKPSIELMSIVLALRYLADMIDGAVARKYNKKSKVGGTLDTLSDITLFLVFVWFIVKAFKLSSIWYILLSAPIVITILYYDAVSDHDKLKKTNGTISDVIPFFVNNCILIYIAFFIVYTHIHRKLLK